MSVGVREYTVRCREGVADRLHTHGGYGLSVEYDIQLFFRRAKALQVGWWNDRHLEDLIASAVLDG